MSGSAFVKQGGLPKPDPKPVGKTDGSMNPRVYKQMFGEIAPKQPEAAASQDE